MAHTNTKLTELQAHEALQKLGVAATAFRIAIKDFKAVYDCDTVGLDEWADSISTIWHEVKEDVDNTFED